MAHQRSPETDINDSISSVRCTVMRVPLPPFSRSILAKYAWYELDEGCQPLLESVDPSSRRMYEKLGKGPGPTSASCFCTAALIAGCFGLAFFSSLVMLQRSSQASQTERRSRPRSSSSHARRSLPTATCLRVPGHGEFTVLTAVTEANHNTKIPVELRAASAPRSFSQSSKILSSASGSFMQAEVGLHLPAQVATMALASDHCASMPAGP
jgi:hypothetical protein